MTVFVIVVDICRLLRAQLPHSDRTTHQPPQQDFSERAIHQTERFRVSRPTVDHPSAEASRSAERPDGGPAALGWTNGDIMTADTARGYARPISRIVVIGATGHVGTYLVPRLVRAGHEVVALSRGVRDPYLPAPEWRQVERIDADRDAEDAAGTFGARIAALDADAVVDMICFTPDSAQQLVDALRPRRPLLVHCGTIWVHGPAARVPITEDEPRTAYGPYGTGKAAIEALLHRETVAGGVPSVVLHPGHITGPWPSITPAGNLDLGVWRQLALGEPLPLPDLGLGVLHHVHADDVAQAFELALARPAAIGSSFHVVSEQAMTLRGLAAGVAGWFGREPTFELVGWSEFERRVGAEHAETTREHVGRSIAASIDRARDVLGYRPRYSSLDAIHESLRWLAEHGLVDLDGQQF
jgi:nucleoside-diphosphate-sugar epimerase